MRSEHFAIIVTSDERHIRLVEAEAARRFPLSSIANIQQSRINGFHTLFIGPTGVTPDRREAETDAFERATFIAWLISRGDHTGASPYEWVVVRYGGDKAEIQISSADVKAIP